MSPFPRSMGIIRNISLTQSYGEHQLCVRVLVFDVSPGQKVVRLALCSINNLRATAVVDGGFFFERRQVGFGDGSRRTQTTTAEELVVIVEAEAEAETVTKLDVGHKCQSRVSGVIGWLVAYGLFRFVAYKYG